MSGRKESMGRKIITIMLAAYLILSILIPSINEVSGEDNARAQGKIEVAVSLPDMMSIVRAVGGNYTDCFNILPEGGDPHSFTPTAEQLNRIKKSNIVVFAMSNEFSYESQIKDSLKDDNYQGIVLDFQTDYVPRGAELLNFPGFKNCIHGYWMKPENGIAIAGAVAEALIRAGAPAEAINASLNLFVHETEVMKEKGRELVKEAGLDGKSMVAAVPAVNYILESFGLEVGAILVKEGAGFVSGSELAEIGKDLKAGKYTAVACPEAFKDAKAGEISRQLARDYGTKIVYLKMFYIEESYSGMGYENAARISMSQSGESSSCSNSGVLFFTAAALGVVAVLEGLLLLKPRVMGMRADEEGGIFSEEEERANSQKDMGNSQKDVGNSQKDMDNRQKDVGNSQKNMDNRQKDMGNGERGRSDEKGSRVSDLENGKEREKADKKEEVEEK